MKIHYKNISDFEFIGNKEVAYITGFLLADGYYGDRTIELTTAKHDTAVHEFISSYINSRYHISDITNVEQRRYPRTRTNVYNKQFITHLMSNTGGRAKPLRHVPTIRGDLNRYLLQGIFDADGCISWGHREPNNRIWHKISFTSQYKILEGVQDLLKSIGIIVEIKPKGTEQCHFVSFSNRSDVLKFLEYIYSDNFIILDRKYTNVLQLIDGIKKWEHRND